MKSANVAELKNRLSFYLKLARRGEEVIVRDRNLPIAKLVPFSAEDASDEDLLLVAAGKMRLPENPLDIGAFWKIRTGIVQSSHAIDALLKDREEGL